METPYKKKLKEYNDSISKKKSDLASIQGEIIHKTLRKEPPMQSGNSPPTNASETAKKGKNEGEKAEEFMRNINLLKDILEEKGKFIEIQFEKERLLFENEKARLNKKNEELEKNNQKNNNKIAEQTGIITALQLEIKALKEKADKKSQALEQSQRQNAQYREENTEIKLQNKSLLTENKILAKCCEKLQKGKEEQLKSRPHTFEEKQKKIIQSLYGKTILDSKGSEALEKRYHHHDLSNKLKLDELEEEYASFRKQTLSKLDRKGQQLEEKDKQIALMSEEIRELRKMKKNLQEIRQCEQKMKKEKDEYLLKSQERQDQTEKYINFLKAELEEKPYIPFVKQKIGSIIKIKKLHS